MFYDKCTFYLGTARNRETESQHDTYERVMMNNYLILFYIFPAITFTGSMYIFVLFFPQLYLVVFDLKCQLVWGGWSQSHFYRFFTILDKGGWSDKVSIIMITTEKASLVQSRRFLCHFQTRSGRVNKKQSAFSDGYHL